MKLKYNEWVKQVNVACLRLIGCEFKFICHDPNLLRQGHGDGVGPTEFVGQYIKNHAVKATATYFIP